MAASKGGYVPRARAITPMFFHLPIVAFVAFAALAAVVLGTDRLARPLADDEKKTLGALLREHDYPGARLVALRFAYRLTRARSRAQDLMGRVDERLVRLGWDPTQVSLVRALCRLTWSEWTHSTAEIDKVRRAEETYLRELETSEGVSVPSIERQATEREANREGQALANAQLDKLRASFEAAGDAVNLIWLDAALALESGVPDAQKLAAASGRDVTEFYAAAKRRKRAVGRLLADERGVKWDEEA